MTPKEQLAHELKIRFKLPRNRPTDVELERIVDEIESIETIKTPTDEDWERATRNHVRYGGHYLYDGLDFSDLNMLLAQLKSSLDSY